MVVHGQRFLLFLFLSCFSLFGQGNYLQKYLGTASGTYVWYSDSGLVNAKLYRVTAPGQSTLLTTVPGGVIVDMTEINGIVLTEIIANNHVNVYRSDGTAAGTYAFPGMDALQIFDRMSNARLNGYAYFINLDPVTKLSLMRTNGTTVEEVVNLSNTSLYYVYGLKALDGLLYIRSISDAVLPQLWSSTGQTGSADLLLTFPSTSLHWNAQTWITSMNGALYFVVEGPATPQADPSTYYKFSGGNLTEWLHVDNGYSDAVEVVGNHIFFRVADSAGYEPWATDGTAQGTLRLKDIAAGQANSTPRDFTGFNGLAYFLANGKPAALQSALYASDGSAAGTLPSVDPRLPGALIGLRQMGGSMYFLAPNRGPGFQLAKSQGAAATTEYLTIAPGGLSPGGLNDVYVQTDGTYYYFAYVRNTGNTIYRSNGTTVETLFEF